MKVCFSVFVLFFSSAVFACSTTDSEFKQYDFSYSAEEKESFLKARNAPELVNYKPRQADPTIAEVVLDALQSGVDTQVISKVLKDHNCAYAAKDLDSYKKLTRLLTEEKLYSICSKQYLNSLFIVGASSGVILREGPSKEHKKLGAVYYRTFVRVLDRNGEWARIESHDGEGYVYAPLLEKY